MGGHEEEAHIGEGKPVGDNPEARWQLHGVCHKCLGCKVEFLII